MMILCWLKHQSQILLIVLQLMLMILMFLKNLELLIYLLLLESGAVQPLMSELHWEEVERVNEFEAGLPKLAVEPTSSASSVLIEDADVLVGEGEVTRYYDIFRESVREELHTFYEADQLVVKSSANLNGLTLKPASSHVFSPNRNSFSSLKQNIELNRARLSAKNSFQTADMIEGKVTQAYSKEIFLTKEETLEGVGNLQKTRTKDT